MRNAQTKSKKTACRYTLEDAWVAKIRLCALVTNLHVEQCFLKIGCLLTQVLLCSPPNQFHKMKWTVRNSLKFHIIPTPRQPSLNSFCSHMCSLQFAFSRLRDISMQWNDINGALYAKYDRLCRLAVRVPDYRSRGFGFDSRSYQIFWEVVDLEQGPLSLVRITEELLEWKSSGSGSR
jgi:hypothetical protein